MERTTPIKQLTEEKLESFYHNHYKDYCIKGNQNERIEELEEIVRETWKVCTESILSRFKWRKVEEELPENNKMVLIKDADKCVSIGYYSSFIGEFIDQVTAETEDITEWMPIPE